ncbi:type I restriction endonuclease subunit R [Bacteroides heparinolyticus]|uniref:type I restriction endonuclease subunit R n=1 Tax=Prevotella heparinolytica TaxID=28113 RepID=UPI0023F36E77|nr:HsdR family type I site-specific deoxyribonuclease [Bacteroides heparinolyticus]
MADYIEDLEKQYQNEVVALFLKTLKYKYLGNLQYVKGAKVNSLGQTNGPIIESEVKAYLTEAGYTDMQIEDAMFQLKRTVRLIDKRMVTLMDVNNDVYDLLVSGCSVKPSTEEKERDVMFFNFAEPKKNRFAIAEEVSYIDPLTTCHSRPDIVVYVNGIALCVIELKRSLVSLEEGIRQHLSNESDLIPSFFTTTQFTVSARHAEHKELEQGERVEDELYGFKYATIGTPLSFWCPWKPDTNRTGIVLSDMESFAEFFTKGHFLFLFRYGVLSDGGIKKVMRPHQYHALRAAEPRLQKKASGVIWHSQGSGKSLTMVWLAGYIKANYEDPRVLVITDRTELDRQLSTDFSDAGNNIHHVTSQSDLLKTLHDGKEWLITTLIHKFGKHAKHDENASTDRGTRIPLDRYLADLQEIINKQYPLGFKAKGKHIFVFIDECHRTQGGRLHDAMRAIMGQDVMLIGFTGTPLLKDAKKNGYAAFRNVSEVKFGEFIHKYLHKKAVEDRVILDLQYEAREVEQSITSKAKLDEKLEQIIHGLTNERKQLIKDRWATLERVYSATERIERIGYSILDDMANDSILRQDWANAMLVAGNIYSAYKYYDFFQNHCPDHRLRNRVAVVTSYNPTDNDLRKNTTDTAKLTQEKFKYDMAIQSFKDAGIATEDKTGSADKYETWAKDLFINQPGRMKLLIVVDKLLTGFDAPCATYLYIDKDMRDHTLFQAICRVNRLGCDVKDEEGNVLCHTHKEYGLIVDFKHLFGNIENAVTKFNDENGGLGGFDETDIEELLADSISKNKKRLLAADKAFCALKAIWQSRGLTNNDLLADYYTTDFRDDPAEARRTALYRITGALTAAYDNLADMMTRAGFSTAEADYYEHHAREAAHINLYVKQKSGDLFDPRNYDPDMRALLDRYLRAGEAETIVPATADFSFLDLINDSTDAVDTAEITKKAAGCEKSAAEVIEAKARAVINNSRDKDPAFFLSFSERLQQLLDGLHQVNASFAERMRQLIEFIKETKKGGNDYPEGITTPLQKALWNNRATCGFSTDDYEAEQQVMAAEDLVEYNARPNFRDPASAHGVLFRKELRKRFSTLTDEELQNVYYIAIRN